MRLTWRKTWGHEQTEIDALAALRPELLRQIAEDAIRPFYDPTLAQRVNELWGQYDKGLRKWFRELPPYKTAAAEIGEAHAEMVRQGRVLAGAQYRAERALMAAWSDAIDAPQPPIDDIEPEITASASAPLFTTTDDFCTATRKLIAAKRLLGEGEER